MTLKLRVDSLDEVDAAFHGEYKKVGDQFVLDIEGDHDGELAMRRARDHEKASHKKTKERIAELETELDDMRTQLATRGNSDEALTKSWQAKFDAKVKELTEENERLNGTVSQITAGRQALKIANDVFIVPDTMVDMITKRLKTELVDGKAVVKVLDKEGNVSAMTVDELKAEFRARKEWAPIIKAEGGSGGGTPPQGGKPRTSGDAKDMTEAERIELSKTDPAKFQELFGRK